jgi:glycosyltransferase involved in cell wall biosynthesis
MSDALGTGPFEVAVVIPVFLRPDSLAPILGCLAAQTLDPSRFEVVVVDDCCQVDVAAAVAALGEFAFRLRVLRTSANSGPAGARNLGWKAVQAPILAFIDDDTFPAPEWLEAGLAAMVAQPEVGVLQARTITPPGFDLTGRDDWWVWRVVEQPEPEFMACNIFFRRAAFETTGGFDEVIGWWGEDTAAGWLVVDAGWERGYSAAALAVHPVERRGWAFFLRTALRERHLVRLGVEHPGYRAEKYWRWWAYREDGPLFVLALASAVASVWFLPSLALVLPYLWRRRPSVRHWSFFRLCVQVPLLDATRVGAHLYGSVKYRTFVL